MWIKMDNSDEDLEIFLRACELFRSFPYTHQLVTVEAMEYIYAEHTGYPFVTMPQRYGEVSLSFTRKKPRITQGGMNRISTARSGYLF